MKRQFQVFNYSIKNSSDDSVDIFIDGAIVDAETQEIYKEWFGDNTSVSFKSFREELNASGAKSFNVYINSPGGLVSDAMAIHDLLVDMQSKGKNVNTIGTGIIASAATYILMASKNASMSKNSWFMIHNLSGWAYGDVNEVESQAATLRKFNDATRDFYADATGIRKEDISKMMNAETWLTADEAKDKGFIKNVSGEVKFKNSIPKEHWQFSNMAILNSYNASVKMEQINNQSFIQNQFDDMKKFFQELGSQIMNAVKGVKQPENNDHESLMNAIGEAVSKPFENVGEQVETAIADAVKNATKDYETKIKNLETAKTENEMKIAALEQEITNLKGKATNDPKPADNGYKMRGSFSK